jgi:hypothetical protein
MFAAIGPTARETGLSNVFCGAKRQRPLQHADSSKAAFRSRPTSVICHLPGNWLPSENGALPENVGSRFLSLLQSAHTPNLLRRFRDREKAQLSQAFARQAWGLESGTFPANCSPNADLSPELESRPFYYKLFRLRFQWLSLVMEPEGRYPVRPPAPRYRSNKLPA